MLKLLKEGKFNESNYINDIKKCSDYKKLISKSYFNDELLKYEKHYKRMKIVSKQEHDDKT